MGKNRKIQFSKTSRGRNTVAMEYGIFYLCHYKHFSGFCFSVSCSIDLGLGVRTRRGRVLLTFFRHRVCMGDKPLSFEATDI